MFTLNRNFHSMGMSKPMVNHISNLFTNYFQRISMACKRFDFVEGNGSSFRFPIGIANTKSIIARTNAQNADSRNIPASMTYEDEISRMLS